MHIPIYIHWPSCSLFCQFFYWVFYLFIYLFILLPIHLYIHPSIHPSTHSLTHSLFPRHVSILSLAILLQLFFFTHSKVNLVCLPENVSEPVDGTKCWITGWGRLASGGATPDYLQQASVPIASRARCDQAYPNKIHDSMLCAGLYQGGIDTCQGDSGGPLVCEEKGIYYLHGATSWGYGCADAGKFGVYAKVKYLHQWVKTQMENYKN